jgi:uncharacterized YigZ family protein
MPELLIPSGVGHSDFIESKSRFIGEARRVGNAAAARVSIKKLKLEHPRSSHVAWAYVLGNDAALRGMSDDGEPRGTAGRPILDPIAGSGLTNTLVTVVRYFGGVKLGTGGLSSAYGRASQEALGAMPRVILVERVRIEMVMEYSLYEYSVRLLGKIRGKIVEENFDSTVRLAAEIPVPALDEFRRKMRDASNGTIEINRK